MCSTSSPAKEAPSTLFSSLPDDIVISVLARVPRRYHPILSCVSNKLRSLVSCSELHKTRSLLGKNCFYVCFENLFDPSKIYHRWFTLTEDRRLVSIPFPSPPEPHSGALMVGHDIYFVGGYFNHPTRSMWILDSRSGKFRQGPRSLVATRNAAVGVVDDKIYVSGGVSEAEEIQAQLFDLKTQTWHVAANPTYRLQNCGMSVVSLSLDKKIYVRKFAYVMAYDTRDGKVDHIKLPYEELSSRDVCLIDNVLYVHYEDDGLMWCNPKTKEWRVVCGLELNKAFFCLAMAEYNGKLAFLWQKVKKQDKEIWCTMIALCSSGLEIQGRVEWSNYVGSVPPHNDFLHCLGRTD
ncbi:hypothetical protein CARUB_v10019577mg [Capsella rubella]|uniref:F-box domain-containing protein n=1 Tax=Capsella rubella TaxID=81985 RepID=R0HQB2_9BRAS|nr:putative F-box/kelch-repeat protein At4g02310 [Capsella rubella]EOA26143.1 hypothetical protein CARUB_v10019577mg [Capsella rubella]